MLATCALIMPNKGMVESTTKAIVMMNWTNKLVILLILLMVSPAVLAEVICNSEYVTATDNRISVRPSGGDDTENLQCAINWATDSNLSEVKLGPWNYQIRYIEARDFRGTISGTTRRQTRLVVEDGSVACTSEERHSGYSIFTFIGGEPSLETLSIVSGDICVHGPSFNYAQVRILGDDDSTACRNNTIRATVDRVDFIDTSFNQPYARTNATGLHVAPLSANEGCAEQRLMGQLLVNYSSFNYLSWGIRLRMYGGALVNIRSSKFEEVINAFYTEGGRQELLISGNDFINTITRYDPILQLERRKLSDSDPRMDRLVIHDNTFVLKIDPLYASGRSVGINNGNDRTQVDLSVTENRFVTEGAKPAIFYHLDNGVLSGNTFLGTAPYAIDFITLPETPMTGWFIGNNDFTDWLLEDHSSASHIRTDSNSRDFYIGPGQGAVVHDYGNNNVSQDQD